MSTLFEGTQSDNLKRVNTKEYKILYLYLY